MSNPSARESEVEPAPGREPPARPTPERAAGIAGEVSGGGEARRGAPSREEVGTPADAAAQRRLSDEIAASERRYRNLIDLSPEAILVGKGGRVVLANPAAAELFAARDAAELLGREAVSLFDPESHPAIRERIALLEAGRRVPPRESRAIRLDGEVRLVEVVGAGVPGPDGMAIQLVLRDITERKRAEEALRESEERARLRAAELETVLDAVPAAVWISRDPRGDRIDANRFGAALLRERLGENVSVTAPGEDRPRHFTVRRQGRVLEPDELPIQRAARLGEEIRDAETEVVFDDGEIRHLLGNAVPLRDAEGRPRGSVGAFIDVTGRKRAEDALRDADRRKTEFIAVLSHELRNPLAPIRNAIVLLERSPPDSPVARRAWEVLQRQTQQLNRIVDDLLDISRITHGKIELRLATLDAREVVRRCYADAKGLFDQREVELLLSEPPEPAWVAADAERLSQMLGNLLQNALKFTPPRGVVQVKVTRRGGACELSVRDTGLGLDPAEQERIFDPFAQAKRTRPGQGGLGLGLALVRELAQKHGGAVRAESAGPGKGAEFVIQLPLVPSPEQAAAPGPGAGGAGALSVLVVEDNEDAGATLLDLLGLFGHEVKLVVTGAGAVESARASPPDVLLCDIGLPDMSGHDVIRAVRAAAEGQRVFAVALTGYAQPQDREAALAAGFDAHLAKPPPLEELQALLAEVARRRGARA